MNERIKELILEAGFPQFGKMYVVTDGEELERFAELIVRECLKCGDNLSKHYIENHPEKEQVLLLASIADYSNEIRKHFGIKE